MHPLTKAIFSQVQITGIVKRVCILTQKITSVNHHFGHKIKIESKTVEESRTISPYL